MKVVITDFAINELKSIHAYYKRAASKTVADKLIHKILNAVQKLKLSSRIGTSEPNLQLLGLKHKFILAGNYKIIFRTEGDKIYITDFFDTRQNPVKIILRNKKA